jgi:rod shape-determining protein MreD
MKRVVAYLFLGVVFVLFQTTLLSRLLPFQTKPDLLLILIVYLGLTENFLRGSFLAYLFGCLLDVFSGSYLGLCGLTFLVIFLAVRGTASHFNTESSLLLLFMVFCGTLLQSAVLILALVFFVDAGSSWLIILGSLLPQLLLNLLAALVLLWVLPRLQRRFLPFLAIPGLHRLDSRYGP